MDNNALDIVAAFPEQKFNVLIPIKTVAQIADIQSPVMNTVFISTNLDDKEIYLQEKASKEYMDTYGNVYPAKPNMYALTKKGLTKLMRAAGIKQLSSRPLIPSTCQKCAEVNRGFGKAINCGSCENKDVKYECVIIVPQLTGESLTIVSTKEIVVKDAIAEMKEKQKTEFLKFRCEMCESKALNRALRTAMQIKGSYALEELKKPFVVAYLVPNLNDPLVKQRAVESMFGGIQQLFGEKAARKIVVDEDSGELFEGVCSEVPDQQQEPPNSQVPPATRRAEPKTAGQTPPYKRWTCQTCGKEINDSVARYSMEHLGAPLCVTHQK